MSKPWCELCCCTFINATSSINNNSLFSYTLFNFYNVFYNVNKLKKTKFLCFTLYLKFDKVKSDKDYVVFSNQIFVFVIFPANKEVS